MPIFRVKSVKIYTGQKKFTRVYPWRPWQISDMDFSSKCVFSVKFSICESKKVAVQPYSGDELCSAISWKRYGIWNWHHSMQNLMLAHLWMDFHGPSKSKKYIMSSVSGALFTITAMCAKDTHAHSCHSRVVLHFARPWYPVIRQDFKILWV